MEERERRGAAQLKSQGSNESNKVSNKDELEIAVENVNVVPVALVSLNSSKKLLSEHQSAGGTSRSFGRSSKFVQRVQEISDKQKI